MIKRTAMVLAIVASALFLASAHGDAAPETIWTGSAGTPDWFTPGNWSDGVPMLGAVATINAGNVTLDASTPPLAAFNLNGGTLTFSGWDTLLTATTVTVKATITHLPQSATTTNASGLWVPDNRVQIACSNLVVATNGIINANAKGYGGVKDVGGYGPGGGKYSSTKGSGWGGSFGGVGGLATTDLRYGDVSSSMDPGSGGGSYPGYAPSLGGGGAVRIAAEGTVTLNGTVTANGGAAPQYGAGSSGGSIFITCHTFTGTNGTLSANGSDAKPISNGGGGGGGGRIALVYNSAAQATQNLTAKPNVKIVAAGGIGSTKLPSARPGTIYLTDFGFFPTDSLWGGVLCIPEFESWAPVSLTISGGLAVFTNGFELSVGSDLVIRDNGGIEMVDGVLGVGGDMRLNNTNSDYALSWLWPASGDSFTVAGDLVVNKSHLRWYGATGDVASITVGGSIIMTNKGLFSVYSAPTNAASPEWGALVSVGQAIRLDGSSWIYPYSAPTNGGSPLFRMTTLEIKPSTGFDAYGKGYAGGGAKGWGPGGGGSTGNKLGHGGGGYGGKGGDGASIYKGGSSYGADPTRPKDPGSAGGAWDGTYLGGSGGGLIWLDVAKEAVLDGALNANGYDLTNYGAGGSGGGIYLACSKLMGEGAELTAKGGQGASKGGGGGGGRIAVWCVSNKADTNGWTVAVDGGVGYTDGAEGSIYWGALSAPGSVFTFR